jgi:hypothetical protein
MEELIKLLIPGDTWRCIFTGQYCTIIEVRYYPKMGSYGVKYIKQYRDRESISDITLFLKRHAKFNPAENIQE